MRMHRLVCVFVVRKLPKTGFLALRPIYYCRTVNYKLIFCFGPVKLSLDKYIMAILCSWTSTLWPYYVPGQVIMAILCSWTSTLWPYYVPGQVHYGHTMFLDEYIMAILCSWTSTLWPYYVPGQVHYGHIMFLDKYIMAILCSWTSHYGHIMFLDKSFLYCFFHTSV